MEIDVASSGFADGTISLMDENANSPGPLDPSVLYDQENHVSSAVWDGQERGVLRCHEHTSKLGEWRLTHQQIELVEKAGFGYLRRLPSISLDNPLISALIERWRKETNTFHFRVGEMTITLEDMALLLGLAIDGEPVLGVTYTSCKPICEKFLGKIPDAGYMSGGMVKLSWLKEFFSQCPEDAPLEEIERHTRAYLLYLVGSTIFSTTTGNKVPIMYLPLFDNFEKAGSYAWGAAALSFLYRALGRATLKSQSTISGCLTLLQCWSYFHLNIAQPKFYQEPVRNCFPFVHWWKGKQSAATVKRDIVYYRKALDSLNPNDVDWLPYNNVDSRLIPENVTSSLILGRSKTMLICFDKAERHLPDRCLRQYGMLQGIPLDVEHWERKTRGVDSGIHLSGKMESELNEWSARYHHIVQDDGGVDESEYMNWYFSITRKYVGRPVSPLPQIQQTVTFRTKKKRMSSGLRDIAHIADTFVTEGLDPMQFESISRIRAIVHDCLGDEVGVTSVAPAPAAAAMTALDTPQVELGKRKREKERVRRNTKVKGKRKRKEDSIHCYTSKDMNPVHIYNAAFRAEQSHLCCHCHAFGHQVAFSQLEHLHNKLAKKMRKKEKARKRASKKASRKRKKKDDTVKCDADGENTQYEFDNAAVKDNDNLIQQTCATSNDYQVQLFHAADEGVCSPPYHADVEFVDSKPCHADGGGAESSQPDGGFDDSQPRHAVLEGEQSGSYGTAADGEGTESSRPDCASQATHVAVEGEQSVSCHASIDVAESCHAGNKVVGSNLTELGNEINDLNQSPVTGESLPQTEVASKAVPESSIKPVDDVAQDADGRDEAVK
ncbi:protein MAIN-LIKE 2-like isoform X2 [Mercurialis annua]|uniref:protein MAIN-LIKE 2-like isoform X2 n=1 Tax=Mercurialis annua TaxID=3986 RepID=UPI00215F5C70|nr:protein MAIN-LIKE 2-like isoform X2 [Mercurialis annua]